MCPNMACQPLRAPSEASTSAEPRLKVMANLEGTRMIMGKKMKKASSRNTAPLPAKTIK